MFSVNPFPVANILTADNNVARKPPTISYMWALAHIEIKALLMVIVRYKQKIPLDYLDDKDIQLNMNILERELTDLKYDVELANQTLIFKSNEIIQSHWLKMSLPNGKIHFYIDEKHLIIDCTSKIVGAFLIGLIISIIAIWINAIPLIIIGFFPFGAEYYFRRVRIKNLIIKTYSKKERNYSNDNIVRKMPAYFIYIILAILSYFIIVIFK